MPIKETQAGHGIGGRHNYLLFDESIVFPQCFACNCIKHGEYGKFALFLIKKHSRQWYEEKLKYKVVQYTKVDYDKIADKYKKKLKKYGAKNDRINY